MHARSPRFPLFDSLRAVAAVSVLAHHAGDYSGFLRGTDPFVSWVARLDVGVAIFFLISGFLLYRPFVQARMRDEGQPSTVAYAWRRLLRIGPAYWLALTVTALVVGSVGLSSLKAGLVYYGFAQTYFPVYSLGGIPAAWTLCVEVSFYAFLPLWAWLMRRVPGSRLRSEALGLVALFCLAIAYKVWLLSKSPTPDDVGGVHGLLLLPAFLDQFALGMGLAVASVACADRPELPRPLRVLDRFPGLGWLFALVMLFLVSTQLGLGGGGFDEPTTPHQYMERHLLYGLLALGLIVPAVFGDQERGLTRRVLGLPAIAYVGVVSYGVYLWHFGVFTVFAELGLPRDGVGPLPSFVVWFVLGLAVSVAIASLSWWLVERPLLRLKRLVPGRRARTAAALSP
ncbi:MAG TPA: acyltransferase [Thermoleophilaceae bacterium]|nr:acyltransferase [Thermoleophilaceae bacterium]